MALNDKSLELVEEINRVLGDLEKYWPLTVRGLYYQLVSELIIENSKKSYKRLVTLLVKARMAGLVPWRAFHDRVRTHTTWDSDIDLKEFTDREVENFLTFYDRDLLQTQYKAVEVWIEKDAMYTYARDVAEQYQVPVVVSRGFTSLSFVHECAKRIDESIGEGWPTHILYFGDLDPSGWEIPLAIERRLDEMLDLPDGAFQIERVALLTRHVDQYDLPFDPTAGKPKDSRYRKFVERFGNVAVELDALRPPVFQEVLREAIERTLKMDAFRSERKIQDEERRKLEDLRHSIIDTIERQIEERD
jgi:hypothetical protein